MLLFSRALCKVQTVNYEWLTLVILFNMTHKLKCLLLNLRQGFGVDNSY